MGLHRDTDCSVFLLIYQASLWKNLRQARKPRLQPGPNEGLTLRTQQKNTSRHSWKARTWTAWDLLQFRRDRGLTQKQMSKRLGISMSRYEILESPQFLVPYPLPNDIADRLKAMQQLAAGQVRKMPEAHCPVHNCRLQQHRGRWLGQLRGKMRRWWAHCPGEREVYTVRIDGLVQKAPSLAPRRKRGKLGGGRSPKAESEKQNFRIGDEVERVKQATFVRFIKVKRALPKRTRARKDLLRPKLKAAGFSNEALEAALSARTATIAARNFVAAAHHLQFSTVAKYHREYLKSRPQLQP